MTIEKIQFFLDLVQTLNYTETAEHFFTTQSNISKQIAALEKELDTLLFYRQHRTVSLSPAGKAFYPLAQNLFREYQNMKSAMIPFRHSVRQNLNIGSIPVMSHYNVTKLLSQTFCRLHGNIALAVREMESIHLFSSLDNGSFEIICTRLFYAKDKKYDILVFDHDEFVAVLPQTHPLADRKELSITDLKQETFLQLDENTMQFQVFHNACLSAGFEPKVGYTGTRLDTILSFISSNMGISLLMHRSVSALNQPGIKIIPLSDPVSSELAFVRLKKEKHSKACDTFWNYLHILSIHANSSSKS